MFHDSRSISLFLTSFLIGSVIDYDKADKIAGETIWSLTRPVKHDKIGFDPIFLARVKLFTAKQIDTIVEFLNFMQKKHGEDFPSDDPLLALESYWAAPKDDKEINALLIDYGADLKVAIKNGIRLYWAACKGDKDMVELLIVKGADINVKNEKGWNPLHVITAGWNDVKAKQCDGWTPLHFATRFGHEEIAELLITKGADINAEDKHGKTPLDYAETEEIKQLLIKHNARQGNK